MKSIRGFILNSIRFTPLVFRESGVTKLTGAKKLSKLSCDIGAWLKSSCEVK